MATENKGDKTSLAVTITAIATLITAMGGLIYAWKSKNFSENPQTEIIKPVVNPTNSSTNKIFYGKVGKLDATFNLTFDSTSTTVSGHYYYDKKQNELYQLSGIYMKGDLQLNEYTNRILTANCVLKRDNFGCFAGKMFNQDGRKYDMSICE